METILKAHTKPASQSWKPAIPLASVIWRGMIIWLLIGLILLCRLLYPGFLARDNIFNILTQNVQVGLIALGMTFVMIAGGFDLSVGAIYAAGATVYATEAKVMALPLAALLALTAGLIAGTLNGLIVTQLGSILSSRPWARPQSSVVLPIFSRTQLQCWWIDPTLPYWGPGGGLACQFLSRCLSWLTR